MVHGSPRQGVAHEYSDRMQWSAHMKRTFTFVVVLGCIFMSLFCVYIYPSISGYNGYKSSFVPINKFGVRTFHNVCIEISHEPITHSIQFKNSERTFTESKRIVIYDHVFNGSDSLRLSVAGSSNTGWNWWDVYYRSSGRVPEGSRYLADTVAYFVAPVCPGNLHHFWEEEFRVLHSVVSASNRLSARTKNQLLYRVPWDLEPDDLDCYDVRVYEKLLFLLNFERSHDVFYKMDAGVCFEQAVFGLADLSGTKRDASNYVLDKLGISYDSCPDKVVTIIQRKYRKILNMNNLVNITRMEGFDNVNVVKLEDLSIEEQVRTVACSSVLVGVQGAGLQWAIFMRPGSTLIEIAWPSKHWKYYFNGFVPAYNIYHRGVLAHHLRVNWVAYQNKVRGGQMVSPEERATLLKSVPKSPDLDNIWKWADPIVAEKHYMFALRSHKFAQSIKDH